jgi:MYXO-CTERM domain-containing protein
VLALGAAALTPQPALAATKFWSGLAGDGNWATGGNWDGGTPPVAGDDLVFPLGIGQMTNNDFPPGTTFNSITIAASGFTLNGNAVTLSSGGIQANYSATSTINLPISGNGTPINVVQTGSTLVFGGSINDVGGPVKHGLGTAVLLAPGVANGWLVATGILNVQNGGALGAIGVVVQSGATLQVQGGITVPTGIGLSGGTGAANTTGAVQSVSGNNTLTGGLIFAHDSTVSADAGATLTISMTPVGTEISGVTLTFNAIGTITVSSEVQGTQPVTALTKTGAGTLTLSGPNTYTGPTTVSAGTLLVNGNQPSSAVTVASGATLGGTGTTGPVTVSGIVNPGVAGPGVLHTGNTTFNLGSTFAVDLNGTTAGSGYDELFASGAVTLTGPTLAVAVGFPSATGNTYTILQSTGTLSGGFLGLGEGATFPSGGRSFRINYAVNSVTLTDVTPAPTATSTPTVSPTPPAGAATATPTPPPGGCILGDINCDGIVDIRDYGIWRQNFGQTNCGNVADLDGNCIVDIRDYGIWRQNFGHTSGAAARTATPLPTPRSGAVPAGMTPRQAEGGPPVVPLIPLVGGLLGLGGLAGWRRRRPPGTQ